MKKGISLLFALVATAVVAASAQANRQAAVSAVSCKSQLNSCMVSCRKTTTEAPQTQACQEECNRKAASCTEPKR